MKNMIEDRFHDINIIITNNKEEAGFDFMRK